MRVVSRLLWAAVIALAVVCSMSPRGSAGSEGLTADSGHRFLRVGNYYLNASRIDYVVSESNGLSVVFGSEAANRLKLTGSEAAAMRRWLDERAADQGRSKPGGYSPQGDHQPGNYPPGSDAGSVRVKPQQGDYPQGEYRVVPGQTSNGTRP
jgi:hypothetical protein